MGIPDTDYPTTIKMSSPSKIILFGRGLATGPSVYLASKQPIAGLILMSGFLSIYRIMANFRWTLPGDIFSNIDNIKKVECPVCIIHSIKDEVINLFLNTLIKNYTNGFGQN